MIGASFAAIALIIGLVYAQQVRKHRESIRADGVALTRVISGVDMSQLLPKSGKPSLIATFASIQKSNAFAYGAVVTPTGGKLFEVVAPGSTVPPATMPTDPPSWFGEHSLVLPGNGRNIREFFGPVLKNGELAGFIREGYYENPQNLRATEFSYVALLALPVFLLTAMSYFLIRREIQPFAAIGAKIEELGVADNHAMKAGTQLELRHYVQRFEHHVETVESRISDLKTQYLEVQTSNRLLSYKQEKTQAVLNAIPEAVLVLDDTAVPIFANPKVEPFLGVSRKELIGKTPENWCKDKPLLELLMHLRQQAGLSLHASSIIFSPEDNPQRKVSVAAIPLLTPRDPTTLFGTLVIFRDISREHFAKEAATDFVAQVSHELKTPLQTLMTYSELLLDYGELSEGERVDAVNVIHDEVERVAALINNLLNISKLETGTMPVARKRVKLADLLRDSAEKMLKNAVSKGVKLELKIPPDIESVALDKELFRIAIDNLLSNAIKYSDSGGKVTLTVKHLDDQEMKISVRDEGIGMSPEECKQVFDKYYRSSSHLVASRSGHGLGLYVARKIIDLHHGKLSVSSELGKGTEFAIQFSAQPARLQEAVTV
ncbi:alkaline phosphatase synthesis sensor protein PhoR [mine drainage metagenome]|uniref:histidine kinase n=1 Tax=mine drainage metagenome TaxID=410659 RepID=A0A1J5RW09_9ZZZZ